MHISSKADVFYVNTWSEVARNVTELMGQLIVLNVWVGTTCRRMEDVQVVLVLMSIVWFVRGSTSVWVVGMGSMLTMGLASLVSWSTRIAILATKGNAQLATVVTFKRRQESVHFATQLIKVAQNVAMLPTVPNASRLNTLKMVYV